MKKSAKDKPVLQSGNPFCDWQAMNHVPGSLQAGTSKRGKVSSKSAIYRHRGNYKWKGVKTEAYKITGRDWSKIIRRTLVGDGLKTKSHVRYFEIAPGGRSSFEKHRHEHVIIGVRGRGKVLLGRKTHMTGFLDVVYVSPNIPHQLLNPFDEPFGFICVVPAKRDKPKLLSH